VLPFVFIGAGAVLVVLYVLVGPSRAEASAISPAVGRGFQFLPNVNWSGVGREIRYAIDVANEVYLAIAGQPVVVTSLNDSVHMPGSLHYAGSAADLRTHTLSGDQVQRVWSALNARLYWQGFDVVLESNHIHVEYDPKPGREFAG